nr:hypothetical protein [Tanacetum cinerariifolium]
MAVHIIVKDMRLRIGKSNFRLRSDITSKKSTLQLVYDVLRLIPSTRRFWEMLHICPRLPGQTFDELLFEEEILEFLRYLGHSGEIRKLTDVNINKLHQPWRSFAAVINRCLSGKIFVQQVEHKEAKKSNEMYHLRFTKVIIHYCMTKDPSIPRRNKVNWHYVRDGQMFIMIKLVSRHQNTQQFGAMLHVELTNEDIRNSEAYKEYYAIASGVSPPKTKASVRKTKSSFDTTITPPTAEQMKLATKKSLQQTHISQVSGSGADKGTSTIPWVHDVPTDASDEEISWKSSDEEDDDEGDERSDDQDDDDQDDDDQEENDDNQDTDNDGDDFVHPKLSIHEEEAKYEESFDPIVQTPKNSNDKGIDSLFETTPRVDVQASTTVVPLTLTAPTLPPPTIPTISKVTQALTPPTTAPSTLLQDLPNFGSLFGFDHRLKTLEANFLEFLQTNQFAGAVSFIPGIVERYMDQRMNEAIIKEQVKEQVKVQVSKFLPNIKKTLNEKLEAEVLTRSSNSSKTSYVVAVDLSKMELKKILIEKMKSKKSIHRSDEQRNLYKALIKMKNPLLDQTGGPRDEEKEKSHSQQAIQRKRLPRPLASLPKGLNLIKRLQASLHQQRSQGKKTQDLEETSHQEFETGAANDQPIVKASQHPEWFQQQKKPPTPDRAWNKTRPATHESIQPLVELEFFLEEVYKETTDQLDRNNLEGQRYPHNLLKSLLLIPNSRCRRVIPFDHLINNDLEYLRGGASSRKYTTFVTKTKVADYGHIKWIEELVPRTIWSQEPIGYDKYDIWGISHWGRKRQQFYGFAVNRESACDVYSKRKIIVVTEL